MKVLSKQNSAPKPKMRVIIAERSEPKKYFPCSMCITKTKVYRRYRFVIEDERGRQKAYCLPCASQLLGRSQGDLRKEADTAATR